jgi:hypothetical protein
MPTSIGWTAELLRLSNTTTFKLSRGKNFSYPGFVLPTCQLVYFQMKKGFV